MFDYFRILIYIYIMKDLRGNKMKENTKSFCIDERCEYYHRNRNLFGGLIEKGLFRKHVYTFRNYLGF